MSGYLPPNMSGDDKDVAIRVGMETDIPDSLERLERLYQEFRGKVADMQDIGFGSKEQMKQAREYEAAVLRGIRRIREEQKLAYDEEMQRLRDRLSREKDEVARAGLEGQMEALRDQRKDDDRRLKQLGWDFGEDRDALRFMPGPPAPPGEGGGGGAAAAAGLGGFGRVFGTAGRLIPALGIFASIYGILNEIGEMVNTWEAAEPQLLRLRRSARFTTDSVLRLSESFNYTGQEVMEATSALARLTGNANDADSIFMGARITGLMPSDLASFGLLTRFGGMQAGAFDVNRLVQAGVRSGQMGGSQGFGLFPELLGALNTMTDAGWRFGLQREPVDQYLGALTHMVQASDGMLNYPRATQVYQQASNALTGNELLMSALMQDENMPYEEAYYQSFKGAKDPRNIQVFLKYLSRLTGGHELQTVQIAQSQLGLNPNFLRDALRKGMFDFSDWQDLAADVKSDRDDLIPEEMGSLPERANATKWRIRYEGGSKIGPTLTRAELALRQTELAAVNAMGENWDSMIAMMAKGTPIEKMIPSMMKGGLGSLSKLLMEPWKAFGGEFGTGDYPVIQEYVLSQLPTWERLAAGGGDTPASKFFAPFYSPLVQMGKMVRMQKTFSDVAMNGGGPDDAIAAAAWSEQGDQVKGLIAGATTIFSVFNDVSVPVFAKAVTEGVEAALIRVALGGKLALITGTSVSHPGTPDPQATPPAPKRVSGRQ